MRATYRHVPISKSQVIEAVDLWTGAGVQENVDVHFRDGIVTSIEPSAKAARGRVLLPAGIDTQVHLRVPGQAEKETADSGCLAALHGGVGAMLTMPNTNPFIDNVQTLQMAQEEVQPLEAEFGVKVLFSACISLAQKGMEVAPLRELAAAGAVAFTDDGKGVLTSKVMEDAFAILQDLELPLLQHAEMPGAQGPLAPGPVQESLGLKPYLANLETDMIKRDLQILEGYPKARYHVLHLSSGDSVHLLEEAKRKGLRVTGEVTPHHLYFSSEDIQADNKSFKMNPPLRSSQDRKVLQAALAKGQIDWMATDHAPHEADTKVANFQSASFGTTGLETSLQVLLWMVHQKMLTPSRMVQVWSAEPAKFLGLQEEFGDIRVGRRLRAVLVDISQNVMVEERMMWGLSKNSCFLGQTLPGKIIAHYTSSGCFDFEV